MTSRPPDAARVALDSGSHRGHLRRALAGAGYRRLYSVRLAAQFGDGMFQASLAGAVLFNPERQAHSADIAAAFAVLLLPYSVIGPFAGVLLDRWWRRRVLQAANLARAVAVLGVGTEIGLGWGGFGFYASALVVLSIARFVLSALSASLPRVVASAELVTANAFSTTSGAFIAAVGGASALALRAVLGSGNGDYAVIAVVSALPFAAAAMIASGFDLRALGPVESERRAKESAAEIVRGLRAGAQYAWQIAPVRNALAATGVQRLCYGVTTVSTVLLYRNYFHNDGFFRAGLAGLSQVIACLVVGGALAAVTTPVLFRRLGGVRLPAILLLVAAADLLVFVLPYRKPLQLVAALFLGYAAQGFKISVDTIVQQRIADGYRGRVFTIYDMLFNVALVTAAVLVAVFLPDSGHSSAGVAVVALVYVVTCIAYVSGSRRATA